VALLTLLYTVACSIGLAHSKGWEALGWLFYGFYGNWLGASAGFLLGLIGCFRHRHFRASALRAMGYSAIVAAIPIAVFFTAYFISVYVIQS
jgi:hypothetical protein